MASDQLDDFEMKPLTSGLGFNKRPVNLKESLKKTSASSLTTRGALPNRPADEMFDAPVTQNRSAKEMIKEIQDSIAQGNKSGFPIEKSGHIGSGQVKLGVKSNVRLSETLPRDASEVAYQPDLDPRPTPGGGKRSPLDKVNFQIPEKGITEKTGVRRGANDNLTASLVPTSFSFGAFVLDAMIIVAMSLIFLLGLIVATGLDLGRVIASAQGEMGAQVSLVIMYFAVFGMYSIVSRSFFGKTVGEWTFDLQLGSDEELNQALYPAKVLWRSLVHVATGLVLLPLISLMTNRDIAGKVSGLQMYKKNF